MRKEDLIAFDAPAKDWNEALPVGNGTMGAMVFGGIGTELLQLNEDSIWYGGPRDRINPSARGKLPVIRKALSEGRISQAEDLCALALSGTPDTQSRYEPLGNLYILFDGDEEGVTDYKRSLDLSEGAASVSFVKDGCTYKREIMASYPDKVIAVRLTSEGGTMSFRTCLCRGNITWDMRPYSQQVYRKPGYNLGIDTVADIGGAVTYMTGRTGGEDSVSFGCGIKVITSGGTVEEIGDAIVVREAESALILISASTSFYEKNREDIKDTVCARLESAAAKGYKAIRADHISDHKDLYDRVYLELPQDQWEITRLFNFGRYLMIAGSRPGSQPLNLQGIWNKDTDPMWGSKYTININLQMNYWPAEVCALPECHMPLFDLIERMRPGGCEVARRMYGARGFAAHHNTDIYGDCAPQDTCLSSTYWVMGAAWLCLHIMEHYDFTLDMAFLREHFDTMIEAAQFLIDYACVEDGFLCLYPTVSPENEYELPGGERGCVCKGAAMDDQIMGELFRACIRAASVLGKEKDPEIKEIEKALEKVRPIGITEDGRIREWNGPERETDPGHRHISHLFALMPGHGISKDTPQLMEAAKKTLEVRLGNGGGHTGWSRAWIINMYARLGDGDGALSHIAALQDKSLLPNLFDDHPPFQIDGNFGLTSGIAQMLLQSDGDDVQLLPALPGKWDHGCVKGLCAKGGKRVDITWEDGRVVTSRIY